MKFSDVPVGTVVLVQNEHGYPELAGYVSRVNNNDQKMLTPPWETKKDLDEPDHPDGHPAILVDLGEDTGDEDVIIDKGRVNLLDFTSVDDLEEDGLDGRD